MGAEAVTRIGMRLVVVVALALATGGCPRDAVDEKRSDTRVDLAKDFLRRNELDNAESEGKKALAMNPRNADAEYVLGLVALLRGVANVRLLEVDDCLTGVDAEGLQSERDGFLDAAEAHLGRAVEFDDEHAEAWSSRGTVADQLGDPARAIGYFERALRTPARLLDVGVTRANLGWAYFHRGDHARAAKELRQALQFHRDMCVAKYRLGRIYGERKEWAKAVEQLSGVVADRSCPMQEAHLHLLRAARQLGAVEVAVAARASCVAAAARSCIAAECRAEPE